MSNTYTTKDVAEHKDEKNGVWIIVDSEVYDVTSTITFFCLASPPESPFSRSF